MSAVSHQRTFGADLEHVVDAGELFRGNLALGGIPPTIGFGAAAMRTYHGSCHCGVVKFEVDADLSRLGRCNCSICSKQGGLFIRVPPAQFRLLEGDGELAIYRFNTMMAEHFFCKHCGMHPFRHPRSGPELYLVNVRCLDDFDLETEKYEVNLFDGRNWETADAARKEGS